MEKQRNFYLAHQIQLVILRKQCSINGPKVNNIDLYFRRHFAYLGCSFVSLLFDSGSQSLMAYEIKNAKRVRLHCQAINSIRYFLFSSNLFFFRILDWAAEAVPKAEVLRLIYQGRFLHCNVTLGALVLPMGKTTVMHLVPRDNLPEPNSQGK